jgi:hypothetical protein
MSLNSEDDKLLRDIVAHFGEYAHDHERSWHLQVWDDQDQVLCDGDLRSGNGQFGLFDDTSDPMAVMFHPPYRVQLTADGSPVACQRGINRGAGWQKIPPSSGSLK